jgi:16S rRNA (cytosine967-C5)-methyltransferase
MRPVNAGMAGSSFDGNRRRLTSELWSRYLSANSLCQLDKWISKTLREYKAFGKRDRLAYADALFGAARFSGTAIILEKAFGDRISGSEELNRIWAACWPVSESDWLTAMKAVPYDILFLWIRIFSGIQYKADEDVTGRLAWWKSFLNRNISDSVITRVISGIPHFLSEELNRRSRLSDWGEAEGKQFLSNLSTRPPLWVRILDAKKTSEVTAGFSAKGFDFRQSGSSMALFGKANIRTSESYLRGYVEIQDMASQHIVDKVGAMPGELIWDACAGGGGKTVSIAAGMNGTGLVYASDTRGYKLDELQKRTARANIRNVKTFEADAAQKLSWDNEVTRNNGFDRVLIDAPCSAGGTWRRNPDARWHINPDSLARLAVIQDGLISACSKSVKPGGKLIYATCSWLPVENEERIEKFLAESTNWKLQEMAIVGSPHEDADTMFAAVLTKKQVERQYA